MKLSYRGICYDYKPVNGETQNHQAPIEQTRSGGTPFKTGQETQRPDTPVTLKYRGIPYIGLC